MNRHSTQEIHDWGSAALVIAFIILAFALTGCSLKSQQLANVTLQAADLASTYAAERAGGVEVNPVMDVPWPVRVALKSATVGITLYATNVLERRGHTTASRWMLYVINTTLLAVVANNVTVSW